MQTTPAELLILLSLCCGSDFFAILLLIYSSQLAANIYFSEVNTNQMHQHCIIKSNATIIL